MRWAIDISPVAYSIQQLAFAARWAYEDKQDLLQGGTLYEECLNGGRLRLRDQFLQLQGAGFGGAEVSKETARTSPT